MSKAKPTYEELEQRCAATESESASILEGMSDAFFALDDNMVVTHFNGTAGRYLGRHPADVVGRPFLQTFPKLQGSIFENTFRQVMESDQPATFETYFDVVPYRNWYEARVYPQPKGVWVYFLVTTERRAAEEALRESRERLSTIFQTSPAGIFLVNAEGSITYANRKMGELFSMPSRELVGTPYIDLVQPSQRLIGYEKMIALMAGEIDSVSLERRYVAKDGRQFIGHLSGRRLFNSDGDLDGLVGIITDITDQKKAQEALEENEQRYRGVFENAAIGIDLVDTEGHFIQVNRSLVRMLGYQEDELLRMSIYDLTHPDDVETSRVKFQGLLKGQRDFYRFEKRFVKKKGEILWVDVSVSPVRGTDGGITGAIGVVADITDRKKTEEDLRESERKYRDLFEAAPVGIFQTTIDGEVLSVNAACARMYGYASPEEAVAQIDNVALRVYVESERRKELIDKAVNTVDFVKAENQFCKKDGSLFWGQLYLRTVRDQSGEVAHLEGFVEDINDRKLADLALKASEAKYRSLFDNSPLGIISVDIDGQILEVNRSLLDILGSPSKEATKAINMFGLPQLVESGVADAFRDCMMTGERVLREIPYASKWDKQSHLRIVMTPLMDAEQCVKGCQAIVEDITEQKRLEEQLRQSQKMEAIGTLAGGIAHDFNNLLQIICGNGELLDMALAEKLLRFDELDAIREAGWRGADLVRQILMFSRKADAKFACIDLNEDVHNAQRLLYRTIPRMIEIELKLGTGLDKVRGDSAQIEQLLINLAVNAKDAMPDGGTLTIETRNVTLGKNDSRPKEGLVPGRHVLLRVSDTGRGIEPHVLQHIFEPFFTTKGLAEATGLGLATAFGIVKMHGGHITCSSMPGEGTTFDMYFPALEPENLDRKTEQKQPPIARGRETILLVDDEELIRDLGKRILERSGYAVLAVATGTEALGIYARQKSDIRLVILDLIMPGMGGKQCLEELLKIDPQVRALIASGFAIEGDTKKFLDAKAKGMVTKPFNMRRLLEAVRKVLDVA